MKDHNNKGQSPESLQERQEAIAYHMTQLYHRLSQDFDRLAVTGGHLAEAIEVFKGEINKFATLDQEVKDQLEISIKGGADQVSASFARTLEQAIKINLAKEITDTAGELRRIIKETGESLRGYERQIRFMRRWDIVLNLVSTLIGVSIFYLLLVYK